MPPAINPSTLAYRFHGLYAVASLWWLSDNFPPNTVVHTRQKLAFDSVNEVHDTPSYGGATTQPPLPTDLKPGIPYYRWSLSRRPTTNGR